ncbi:hypothetical protein DF185_20610 [Marinifilum breve]|uniref:PA14 domain-containing protein n=1 Tax=Marinifilum breve TaxID=2184082 RepID=A0A2V3ZW03_9BACT|nr:choice-of-anchor L domain-containing protein [Marinifilum breve]PXX96184.1 hypothetical protein DF185_20610 [Marinifilum breve]
MSYLQSFLRRAFVLCVFCLISNFLAAQTANVTHPSSATSYDGSISVDWPVSGGKIIRLNGDWQSWNVVNFNGLRAGDYELYYFSYAEGYSGPETVTLIAGGASSYCSSYGQNNNRFGITNVSFNTINESTSGNPSYTDNTGINTSIVTGRSYDLSVSVNTPDNGRDVWTRVWIDWNQNGNFNDSGEQYNLGNTNSDGLTGSSPISITIPTIALEGVTRMRVSAIRANNYPNSCDIGFKGEVEDYSLNIVARVGNSPIANCKDLTVQLDAAGNASISADDINNGSNDVETADADLILSIDKSNFDCSDVGANTVTLTVEDEDGNESTCIANVTVEDNVAPSLLNLNAEYHDERTLSDLKYTESVDEAHTDWGGGSPNTSLLGNDQYSIRYSGNFVIPETGNYTFYTRSDDGVRLYIDGTRVINNWTDHGPTVDNSTRNLTKGQHSIVLEFYENGGGAVVELEWESTDAGITRQVFSKSSVLNHTTVETTIKLDKSGNASLSPDDVDPGFIDNCGVTTRSLNKSNFTTSDVGVNNVILTVRDASGNTAAINVKVTVEEDDTPSTEPIEINTQDPSIGTSPEDLVQNVLVTGCLTADNIRFTGDSRQIGYFNKGSSDFPLAEGIILSTGNVTDAVGENDDSETSTGFGGAGDTDLTRIAGQATNDASVLEFDFTPAGNKVEFRYIFASEEYAEYACSNFNDVFAFLLSGPEINDGTKAQAENIALLDDGVTPVMISTVHGYERDRTSVRRVYDPNGAFSDWRGTYYRETNWVDKTACSPINSHLYVDNQSRERIVYQGGRIRDVYNTAGSYDIEYDGRTVILTATYDVKKCETYHIKLAIADVADDNFDSAVFLEAKSFKSNEVTVENKLDGLDGDKEVMYRGCDKSYISFTRKENLTEAYTFHVNISGTAVNGTDYFEVTESGTKIGNFPEDITFAPGQSEIKIYYMASDEVSGAKDILFEVLRGCPCSTDDSDYFRKKIDILDVGEIKANAISNVTCGGGAAISTIIIELKDGLDPLNYLYSLDGGDFQEPNKFQGSYTVGPHTVTIKDKFSCSSKDVEINIPAPTDLKANAGSDFEMCEKETSRTLNGTGGIVYEWTCDKALGLTDMDLNSENPTISPNVPAGVYTYTLTVSDGVGKACESSDDVVVTVKSTPVINSLVASQTEVCSGAEINLTANVSNAISPTYNWSPSSEIIGAGLSVKAVPVTNVLSSRTYTLEVVSNNNCSATQSVSGIQVNPNPIVSLKAAESNLCSDGTDGEIKVEASGGTPRITGAEYDYLWNHDAALNIDHVNGLAPRTYTVTVRDSKSCQTSLDVQVKTEPKPIGIFY